MSRTKSTTGRCPRHERLDCVELVIARNWRGTIATDSCFPELRSGEPQGVSLGFRHASFQEVTMRIGKKVFAAIFALGLGSSCAYAQTAPTAAQPLPSSAQTSTATTATFTAVVAQVNKAAGTISLTQTLPAKPTALHDFPTATADYQASPSLINKATGGAIVQVTVQQNNGNPAGIAPGGGSAPPSRTAR